MSFHFSELTSLLQNANCFSPMTPLRVQVDGLSKVSIINKTIKQVLFLQFGNIHCSWKKIMNRRYDV